MSDENTQDLTTYRHHLPEWIKQFGGADQVIHSNNVLHYMATSPFWDPQSENQAIMSQYTNTALEAEMFGTRKAFEANLLKRRGISFVVAHDPFENLTKVQTPQGPVQSFTWVIRKQYRDEPYSNNVQPLAYYFIVNNAIYQAPDVSRVLECRLLNVTTSLDRILSKVSNLPNFSTSHGHTWTKPVPKSLSTAAQRQSQQSREGTPMAVDSVAGGKLQPKGHQDGEEDGEDSRTLAQALRMTMQYGQEYGDETRLEGQPGNFRFTAR